MGEIICYNSLGQLVMLLTDNWSVVKLLVDQGEIRPSDDGETPAWCYIARGSGITAEYVLQAPGVWFSHIMVSGVITSPKVSQWFRESVMERVYSLLAYERLVAAHAGCCGGDVQ